MCEFLLKKRFKQSGFTLIEVVVVMGIFVILASFATINLLRPQRSADLNSTVTSIIADIKQQQARSMLGEDAGGSSAVVHGVYFESNRYILFAGPVYSAADASNFVVNLSSGLTLATAFPGSQVTFNLQSGEITGFIGGSNTVTLTATGGQVKNLALNKYGVVSVN